MSVTFPLCQTCGNQVDELTWHLEGKEAKHCQDCRFTYEKKSENIPGGMHIWEESRTGNKENDRLWWQYHKSQDCVQGLYVRMVRTGNSYRAKLEGPCQTCARIYQHVPLEAQFHTRSGAYWYERERYGKALTTLWFPACTECIGGVVLPHNTSCTACQKRFDDWVLAHDAKNVKWSIFGKVGTTRLMDDTSGWHHEWEPPAENGKVLLEKRYTFSDGQRIQLFFWENEEEWAFSKEFKSREKLHKYIDQKTGGNIRNHWQI